MVTLSFDSPDSLGAVYMKFSGEISPTLETDSMSTGYNYDGEYTHVLIYNIEKTYGFHAGELLSGAEIRHLSRGRHGDLRRRESCQYY